MPDAVNLPPALLDAVDAAARDGAGAFPRLRAVEAAARALTGHGLCTAMVFDRDAMTVRRVFSSRPDAYPVGGAKPKRDTAWGRHVLIDGRVFMGEGEAAIRAHFDDHAVIAGLGLASVVNVPVFLAGRCAGTLNLLWAASTLQPGWVATARLLGLLATPDWCSAPAGRIAA
jgi:hypothetical protein